jgi:hypothetical protein
VEQFARLDGTTTRVQLRLQYNEESAARLPATMWLKAGLDAQMRSSLELGTCERSSDKCSSP